MKESALKHNVNVLRLYLHQGKILVYAKTVTVGTSCVFHKKYFTFHNGDCNLNSRTNFVIACGKCSVKVLSDIVVEIATLEISNINSEEF